MVSPKCLVHDLYHAKALASATFSPGQTWVLGTGWGEPMAGSYENMTPSRNNTIFVSKELQEWWVMAQGTQLTSLPHRHNNYKEGEQTKVCCCHGLKGGLHELAQDY